jgi:hypothetical protein
MLETALTLAEADAAYLTTSSQRALQQGHVLDAARSDHRRTETVGKIEGLRLGLGQVRHVEQKWSRGGKPPAPGRDGA